MMLSNVAPTTCFQAEDYMQPCMLKDDSYANYSMKGPETLLLQPNPDIAFQELNASVMPSLPDQLSKNSPVSVQKIDPSLLHSPSFRISNDPHLSGTASYLTEKEHHSSSFSPVESNASPNPVTKKETTIYEINRSKARSNGARYQPTSFLAYFRETNFFLPREMKNWQASNRVGFETHAPVNAPVIFDQQYIRSIFSKNVAVPYVVADVDVSSSELGFNDSGSDAAFLEECAKELTNAFDVKFSTPSQNEADLFSLRHKELPVPILNDILETISVSSRCTPLFDVGDLFRQDSCQLHEKCTTYFRCFIKMLLDKPSLSEELNLGWEKSLTELSNENPIIRYLPDFISSNGYNLFEVYNLLFWSSAGSALSPLRCQSYQNNFRPWFLNPSELRKFGSSVAKRFNSVHHCGFYYCMQKFITAEKVVPIVRFLTLFYETVLRTTEEFVGVQFIFHRDIRNILLDLDDFTPTTCCVMVDLISASGIDGVESFCDRLGTDPPRLIRSFAEVYDLPENIVSSILEEYATCDALALFLAILCSEKYDWK